MKQKPPTPIYHTMGKPKWITSVEEKQNVTITIHWIDKLKWSVEKSFQRVLFNLLASYLANKIKETKMFDWLKGFKTYILVGLGVLGLLVQFLTGDVTFMEFLNSPQLIELLGLLGIGALRAGVKKS